MSTKIKMPRSFGKISEHLVKELSPLLDARVIQILVLRQTHDYSIFRTEESRELNTVVIPESIESEDPAVKVAFLASKQKAVENRMYSRLLRTVKDYDCVLKVEEGLCLECPRCVLFGGVSTKQKEFNIKHRIEYSTAFSIEPYEELLETITFNAVIENTQLTGQALNITHNVKPLANFPSVITLNSVSWEELVLYIKALIASKSYGAETRTKGDVRNAILGIVAGYEEVITSLEYSLELAANWESDLKEETEKILKKYADLSASRRDVVVLSAEETRDLVSEIQDLKLDKSLVDSLDKKTQGFVKAAKQ
ncbi:MAG: type I-D CRISPR-associated protein Cas7/Csc2 [Candidatus Thorarchaeota archaeon]